MNPNQKGTSLEGGSLSDEAMASSVGLLDKGRFGWQKGLQQFFTPDIAAKLIHEVIGNVAVLDLTAGDGSLMKYFESQRSFGVEVDKDQIDNSDGSYHPIEGDVQHVYTLLRGACPAFPAVVLNPPFGLPWEEPTIRGGKRTNSGTMAFIMGIRMLKDEGQMAFICGKGQWEKNISVLPEASGVYAVIEVPDLFDNVRQECVIAFAIHPNNRAASSEGFLTRVLARDQLDLIQGWVCDTRDNALGDYNSVTTWMGHFELGQFTEAFKTIAAEYRRRSDKRLAKDREFDMWVSGKEVRCLPSGYAQAAIHKLGDRNAFTGIDHQSLNYFAQNELLWQKIKSYADAGIIKVEPSLMTTVERMLDAFYEKLVPNYPVTKAQRIAFLQHGGYIKCIKDFPEHGFVKGEMYPVRIKIDTTSKLEVRTEPSKKTIGEWVTSTYDVYRKQLIVTIGPWKFSDSGDDSSENIQTCIDHFKLPDPGHLEQRYPERIAALEDKCLSILDRFAIRSRIWEAKEANKNSMPYSHRPFQRKDIAKILFKGSGLLSWEQGLGKTLGGLLFHQACVEVHGAQDAMLIVTAKDLIPQWEREIERFTGKKPILIKSHGQAKEIATYLKKGRWEDDGSGNLVHKKGQGLYITYYEALTLVGTRGKQQLLPHVTVATKTETKRVPWTGRYGYYYFEDENGKATLEAQYEGPNPDYGNVDCPDEPPTRLLKRKPIPLGKDVSRVEIDGETVRANYGYIPEQYVKIEKEITSRELCPECKADTRNGWNGVYCEAEDDSGKTCGYAHYSVRVKPIASLLSTAFDKGSIILDEIQMIQGNFSKRSRAIRGLNAKHKLGMTGTPIKNFIGQAFWLLWWCLGDGTQDGARFPFSYDTGYGKFESEYSVIEYKLDKKGRKVSRGVRPEITNVSMLWRQLCSSIIRRRKEDTGENLVKKFYHELHVPLGVAQTEQTNAWLKTFHHFFKEKYPDSKVVKAGMEEMLAPMLGLNWKLEYAATLPEGDPDYEWTGVEDVSNWTPGVLKVLELSMALAKNGRKVLIGSNLVPTSKFIAECLVEKGVNAIHIVDENGQTKTADERAKHVYSFQSDKAQVFCAGIKAIRLGHNLDAADAVILHGFDWSYDDMDQFVARVHRLTSKNPIDIYVVLPTLPGQPTITVKKWERLTMKGQAADLALDGRLIQKHEQEIGEQEVIRDLMERGMTVTDDAVDETSVYEAWEAIAHLDDFEVEGVLPERPEIVEEELPAVPVWVQTEEEWLAEQEDAATYDAHAVSQSEEDEEPDYEDDPSIGEVVEVVAPEKDWGEAWTAIHARFFGPDRIVPISTKATRPLPADPEETLTVVAAPEEEQLVLPPEPQPIAEVVEIHSAPTSTPADIIAALKDANELHTLGILDDAEFASLKATLISSLKAAA